MLCHVNGQKQAGGVISIKAEENLAAFKKEATFMETMNREW